MVAGAAGERGGKRDTEENLGAGRAAAATAAAAATTTTTTTPSSL